MAKIIVWYRMELQGVNCKGLLAELTMKIMLAS